MPMFWPAHGSGRLHGADIDLKIHEMCVGGEQHWIIGDGAGGHGHHVVGERRDMRLNCSVALVAMPPTHRSRRR